MLAQTLTLLDASHTPLAEFLITGAEEGWYSGRLLTQRFLPEVHEALRWYAEVVDHQMLSYLDDALAAVERFELRVQWPDGSRQRVFSLHVSPTHEVTFRLTPLVSATPAF